MNTDLNYVRQAIKERRLIRPEQAKALLNSFEQEARVSLELMKIIYAAAAAIHEGIKPEDKEALAQNLLEVLAPALERGGITFEELADSMFKE